MINKQESKGFKHLNDSNDFAEYLNDMNDIYKNIEEYNPNKKRKILIVFDDMIADMLSNNKLNPVVTELFIEVEKNISITFTALLFCAKKILEFYSALRTILL